MRNKIEFLDMPIGFPETERVGMRRKLYDPVSGLIAAGSSLLGSVIGSNASQNAANTQANAANNATQLQQNMFNQTQQNLQPYMPGGGTALSSLLGKLQNGQLGGTFSAQDYLNNQDPGYQFQLQQGQQALQNSQAAQNGIMSGSAMKDLINFNQGTAATGYQNAYNRWLQQQQNTYGQLSGVASLGENAAAGLGNTGASYANGMSNTITGAGNAQAAGQIGSANAINGGLNNAMGYYQLSNMMNGGNNWMGSGMSYQGFGEGLSNLATWGEK